MNTEEATDGITWKNLKGEGIGNQKTQWRNGILKTVCFNGFVNKNLYLMHFLKFLKVMPRSIKQEFTNQKFMPAFW